MSKLYQPNLWEASRATFAKPNGDKPLRLPSPFLAMPTFVFSCLNNLNMRVSVRISIFLHESKSNCLSREARNVGKKIEKNQINLK